LCTETDTFIRMHQLRSIIATIVQGLAAVKCH
jgi:hypothetical protein